MSSKQGHETLESYTDNIRVKISERYKPPPRINLAMTYAQRLTLNKQIQDNMPNYEFLLEKPVVEKMKEWRAARNAMSEDRKARLETVRQEMKKKELERFEQEKLDEVEVKTVEETVTVPNTIFNPTSSNVAFAGGTNVNQSYTNYTTNTSILMPTQAAANYSNILTPIPLNSQGYNSKPVDKSPFNFSDFENDTSSPFDNMELKSINDMEELAQVLKKEEPKYKVNNPMYQPYQSAQSANPAHMQPNYPNYVGYNTYNIPNSTSYVQPAPSNYAHTNGYYYPPDVTQNQAFQSQYAYSKPSTVYNNYSYNNPLVETKKSNCKSVPDIMKSLELDLENSHLDNRLPDTSYIRDSSVPQTSRPKSTEAIIYPRDKVKTEELDDPFDTLLKHEQELCKSISLMGFPLSRVARTCRVVGDDHKKIVEHLLALSDLLDLGFSENDASKVLLQCDNDRDKALDKLIS